MAQISLDELYRGEGNGEEYGIAGEVVKEILLHGCPKDYDEETWREMLLVKHTLLAAEKMRKQGDTIKFDE